MKRVCLTVYLIFTILFFCCTNVAPEQTGLEGKPLPSFSILLQDSTTWLNSKEIREGTPIVLFYFSPYCPYCRSQTEEIIDDIDNLKNIQFYFVTSFPVNTLRDYSKEFKLSKYPNIQAGVDTANFISDYFKAPGVPYMAIYDKKRKLKQTFLGKIYSTQIKKVAVN